MPFKGIHTVVYQVADLAAARDWYTQVLGTPPYFDQPFYVGFSVAGYELGLQSETPSAAPVSNVVAYWGVDDIEAEHARLLALGAQETYPVSDVGDNILLSTVRDPFGNEFGLIRNPHFGKTLSP